MEFENTFPISELLNLFDDKFLGTLTSEITRYNKTAEKYILRYNKKIKYDSIIQSTLESVDEPLLVQDFDTNYLAIIHGGTQSNEVLINIYNLAKLSKYPENEITDWTDISTRIIYDKDYPISDLYNLFADKFNLTLTSEISKYNKSAQNYFYRFNKKLKCDSVIQATLSSVIEPLLVLDFDTNYIAIIHNGKNTKDVFINIYNKAMLSKPKEKLK